MRSPEHVQPVENGAGHERPDDAVLNEMALKKVAKESSPTAEQAIRMTDRLSELNNEIPALVEELNIIERAMGAVDARNDVRHIAMMTENVADVVEPDAPAPKLTPEEFEKLSEARATLTGKIQPLQWERHNIEQVLHPDDYQELERARGELGMTQSALRTFRHPGGMVGHFPAAPEKPTVALEAAPKKTGLLAKLKDFFK